MFDLVCTCVRVCDRENEIYFDTLAKINDDRHAVLKGILHSGLSNFREGGRFTMLFMYICNSVSSFDNTQGEASALFLRISVTAMRTGRRRDDKETLFPIIRFIALLWAWQEASNVLFLSLLHLAVSMIQTVGLILLCYYAIVYVQLCPSCET